MDDRSQPQIIMKRILCPVLWFTLMIQPAFAQVQSAQEQIPPQQEAQEKAQGPEKKPEKKPEKPAPAAR